jgi:hypothetical protein
MGSATGYGAARLESRRVPPSNRREVKTSAKVEHIILLSSLKIHIRNYGVQNEIEFCLGSLQSWRNAKLLLKKRADFSLFNF